ncbi:hypothetical protein NG726_27660 [Pseudomonas sp. MOB-449]|nr:hypothetical protein [Pseudomonas sp. MOB-449]
MDITMKNQIVKEQKLRNDSLMLSEKQAADQLDRSEGTLRNWRTKKGSNVLIPYARNDRKSVFYKLEDILAFAEIKSAKRTEKLHKFPRIDVLFNESPIPKLDPSTRLTTTETALAFGISKASLQIWRSKRQFLAVLPFYGDCHSVHYRAGDLARFIREGRAYWQAQSIKRNHQYRPRT